MFQRTRLLLSRLIDIGVQADPPSKASDAVLRLRHASVQLSRLLLATNAADGDMGGPAATKLAFARGGCAAPGGPGARQSSQ